MKAIGEIRMDSMGFVRFRTQLLWTGTGYEESQSEWSWDGPPIAHLSCRLFPPGAMRKGCGKAGQQATIGPYKVEIVEYDFISGSYLVRRLDQHGFAGAMLALRYQAEQHLTRFGERVVLTLAVWGLAEWPPAGVRPTFEQVRRKWRRVV